MSVDMRGGMINPSTMLRFLCSLLTLFGIQTCFGQVGEIVKYNMLKEFLLVAWILN